MKGTIGFFLSLLFCATPVHAEVFDIAHRGYAAYAPAESSMQAFRNAHALGADGIEFDVRQTQDNVVVVAHDPNIPELSNRAIENIRFTELQLTTEVPSLEAVLSFAKAAGQTVWLEIKQSHRYPGIIDRTLALINQYGLEEVTVIQSFNHNDLYAVHLKQPELRLLALFVSNYRLDRVPAYVGFIGLPISNVYLNGAMMQSARNAGKRVIFWRRDARSESKNVLRQFINIGADGFMLDRSLKQIMNDE